MMINHASSVICDLKVTEPVPSINEFVSFLNRFTTVWAAHEGVFDEYNVEHDSRYVRLFRIETQAETFIQNQCSMQQPPSIILTGNAGDGKTYLCRRMIEFFTGQPLNSWAHSEITISHQGLTLRVVKDLSDFSEQRGHEILRDLQVELQRDVTKTVFLIAANEGRLRAILADDGLESLRLHIEQQLEDGPDIADSCLKVLNFNQVATSAYVNPVLAILTRAEHWETCQGCPAFQGCPIRFNRDRLSNPPISDRMRLLYELLEHLGIHVTFRDMLIHLAYTLTGGLSCEQVIEQIGHPGHELHRRVYYENCFAEEAPSELRDKLAVVKHLRRLNLGNYSFFGVDDFIIHGAPDDPEAEAEHGRLSAPAVDLKGKHFAQRREAYLRGGAVPSKAGERHELLEWMPHCRRKLFFEWQDTNRANRLFPFAFLPDYLRLLAREQGARDRVKGVLIRGLNRAFSGLFVSQTDALYVTSQYAHAVEQPVPVVKLKIPTLSIELTVRNQASDAFEHQRRALELVIPHPRSIGQPVHTEINLLRFEYLMRLAGGGTHNVLAEECSLFIRDLKDQLLTKFGPGVETADRIEFFDVEDNRYTLKTLYVGEDRMTRV